MSRIGPQGPAKLTSPRYHSFHHLIFKHKEHEVFTNFCHQMDHKYKMICIAKPEMDDLFDKAIASVLHTLPNAAQMSSLELDAIHRWALSLKNLYLQNPRCKVTEYWKKKGLKWGRDDLLTFNPGLDTEKLEFENDDRLLMDIDHSVLANCAAMEEWEYNSEESEFESESESESESEDEDIEEPIQTVLEMYDAATDAELELM